MTACHPSRPLAAVVVNGSFRSKLTFEASTVRAECLEFLSWLLLSARKLFVGWSLRRNKNSRQARSLAGLQLNSRRSGFFLRDSFAPSIDIPVVHYPRDNQAMAQEVIFRSRIVLEVVHASGKLHVGLGSARGDRRVATRPEFVYRHQLAGRCAAVGEDAR